MDTLVSLKSVYGDFSVEYEIIPVADENIVQIRKEIAEGIKSADAILDELYVKVDEINKEIDRLTNHADGLDYVVAVISGVLAGMLDSFLVGETVIDKDKIQQELEKKYHTTNDSAYTHKNEDGNWISSAMYHRLDDLAHHPTLGGLIASILVHFFRLVVFVDGSDGKPHIFFADKSSNVDVLHDETRKMQIAWVSAIFSGICMWLASMAEKKYYNENEEEMPEPLKKIVKAIAFAPIIIELLKVVDTWVGHMMSDVSTSQGIPGVFLSLLKEISVLPLVRNSKLRVVVDSLYRDGKLNLSEWGGVVFTAVKKQAMPVIINEALVRGFYFVRHLISEYKKNENVEKIDWNKVIPFGNRTIERMITIASGTFVAFDVADAAIRSGGFNASCLLRVNFVGIGRFAIAIGTDVAMGIKKGEAKEERDRLLSEIICTSNMKLYYKNADLMCDYSDLYKKEEMMHSAEADMWIAVEETQESIDELYEQMEKVGKYYLTTIQEMDKSLDKIEGLLPEVEKMNPGLIDEMLRRLRG